MKGLLLFSVRIDSRLSPRQRRSHSHVEFCTLRLRDRERDGKAAGTGKSLNYGPVSSRTWPSYGPSFSKCCTLSDTQWQNPVLCAEQINLAVYRNEIQMEDSLKERKVNIWVIRVFPKTEGTSILRLAIFARGSYLLCPIWTIDRAAGS